jgi:hypothetical protein
MEKMRVKMEVEDSTVVLYLRDNQKNGFTLLVGKIGGLEEADPVFKLRAVSVLRRMVDAYNKETRR